MLRSSLCLNACRHCLNLGCPSYKDPSLEACTQLLDENLYQSPNETGSHMRIM
eukprot:c5210_g1_i1 orf=3-158(-)